MLSLFANPFTMVAGALLISSPIIIHLINRMRYKRVRWAAMEFLLKSQKRSRRKLIIEQMILLLLRILMVLLVGLLLARFIGCDDAGAQGQNTFHIILIDDTPSTTDPIRSDDGQTRDVFTEAKRLTVEQIAGSAAQATSPQYCTVLRLSELSQPRVIGRLNPTSVEDLKTYLAPFKASLTHVELTDGLKAAKTLFEAERTMKPVLHVVGDFRTADWGERGKETLSKAVDELTTAGVDVHLLDCVVPERTPQQKSPLANDNLAIVDFAPDARIVPKNKEVEFTVRVRNYSNSEKKGVFLRVRVNGQIREDGSVSVPSVPPNGEAIARLTLGSGLSRGAEDETEEAGTPDRFNLVSVHLDGEVGGLSVDNVRYAVVEVRDRVPILIVDNNPKDRGTKEAESYFLQKLFTEPIKGYDVQLRNVADLETLNLQPYASVYLCDVPRISDPARKNLEEYVRGGGGLAFFMGPSIKSDIVKDYNERLYRKGEGVFPVPLDRVVGVDVPEDVRIKNRNDRIFQFYKKLLIRKEMRDHPALEKIYKDGKGETKDATVEQYEKFFNFVVIDRYVSVNQQQMRAGLAGAETLVYLQNTNSMATYNGLVNQLTDRLQEVIAAAGERNKKYVEILTRLRQEVRTVAASTGELYLLAQALDDLLEFQGDQSKGIPGLVEFWGQADNAPLREEFQKLRDLVKFGDPLYVTKPFGKGRVVAFLTSAGASWNDLEGFGRAYYPPLMINLQGYLASAGTDANLVLGNGFEFALDKAAYDSKVKKWHFSEDARLNKAGFRPLGEELMPTDDKAAVYRLAANDGKEPGIYVYKFLEKRTGGGPADAPTRPDYRALAYNIDAIRESDLARANSDDITQIAKGATLHTATDDTYKDQLLKRRKDLSENPWIYLVMLGVLVFEQMMAVRLSFHTRSGEAGGPVTVGAPAGADALVT